MTAEDSTTGPQELEIYSYYNCFSNCKKLRPAIRLPTGVFALSNTKPTDSKPFMPIKAEQVISEHFAAKSGIVYLIRASDKAYRYNNAPGGLLKITDKEKKFMGLAPISNSPSQFKAHMQLLKIDFSLLKGVTKATFGLSENGNLSTEAAYALAQKQVAKEALTEPEAKLVETEVWKAIFAKIQQAQLVAILPNLPFPGATPEMVLAIPAEKLDEAIEFTQMVMEGNPTDPNADAAVAVEGLTPYFGDVDLSAYQTNADPVDAAAAIPAESAQTPVAQEEASTEPIAPTEEAQEKAPEETPASVEPEEATSTEPVTAETIPTPPAAENLPAAAPAGEGTVSVVTRARVLEVGDLNALEERLENFLEGGQKMLSDVRKKSREALVNLAVELDQKEATKTLPANTDEVVVETV